MKYPTRLSDAVHILAFIALYPDCDLTSEIQFLHGAFRRFAECLFFTISE